MLSAAVFGMNLLDRMEAYAALLPNAVDLTIDTVTPNEYTTVEAIPVSTVMWRYAIAVVKLSADPKMIGRRFLVTKANDHRITFRDRQDWLEAGDTITLSPGPIKDMIFLYAPPSDTFAGSAGPNDSKYVLYLFDVEDALTRRGYRGNADQSTAALRGSTQRVGYTMIVERKAALGTVAMDVRREEFYNIRSAYQQVQMLLFDSDLIKNSSGKTLSEITGKARTRTIETAKGKQRVDAIISNFDLEINL